MRTFAVAVLLAGAALAGCNKGSSSSSSPSQATARAGGSTIDPKTPVAKIGDEVITSADLETAAKPQLGRLQAQYAEQEHGVKSQALDKLVEDRLIAAKAKKEGITSEKLVEREVTSKLPTPSPAEVQGVYDRAKAAGQPVPPFEEVKGEIVKMIQGRSGEEARRTFVEKLKSESKVQTMLPPLLPPKVEVAAEGPSKGAGKDAPVTIVTFSDFECPFCSKAEETVKQVMDAYKGKVRLVFRDYPLPFHANAQKASEAAHCAGDQGKYWEMHEKLFANQKALTIPQLKEHAKGIGLDEAKFSSCLDGGSKASLVTAAKKAGDEAGVNGTPAFFINGRLLSGAQPFERFKEIIDHELSASGARL